MAQGKPNPLTHRFRLELNLDNSIEADGIFRECRGFERRQDVIEICEVTHQIWGSQQNRGLAVRTKIPGNSNSGHITLCKAMFSSITLWNWFENVQQGQWAKQRRNVSLTIFDTSREPQARFELAGAWPASYKFADPSVNSTDYLIEELEIAFEGFSRVKA